MHQRLCSVVAYAGLALLIAAPLGAQQLPRFSLTPSSTSANTVPTPTSATYSAGSAQTPTWTIAANCQNVGNVSSYCEYTARVAGSFPNTLQTVRIDYTVSGTSCRSATGSFSVTLTTTAQALFQVNRGTSSCSATGVTFVVTGLTRAAYTSSTTNYLRDVVIEGFQRP